MENHSITTVVLDDETTYTFIEVSEQLNIPEELLREMEELGLFSSIDKAINQIAYSRIESACRLNKDLGINLPGVILALELRDEIAELKQRLKLLERALL